MEAGRGGLLSNHAIFAFNNVPQGDGTTIISGDKFDEQRAFRFDDED